MNDLGIFFFLMVRSVDTNIICPHWSCARNESPIAAIENSPTLAVCVNGLLEVRNAENKIVRRFDGAAKIAGPNMREITRINDYRALGEYNIVLSVIGGHPRACRGRCR